jgi:DNA-binding IclR family transcriptional regulator
VSSSKLVRAGILKAFKAEQRPLTLEQLAQITGYDSLELYSALGALVREGLMEETIVHQHRKLGRRFGRPSRVTAWKLLEPAV